ncbi:hypothetical protein [Pelagicoccus sp. SDUM812002]|uniref:hypothetical protein n=1 Tax=Pelagicoccus sp. SDUM812002 TaxID=3041266 RepID=UPI00280E6645|nr:hypothetical protein [Pelagicoccus sp. SDUM812002]MDQ8187908.1 hypothetical protein [Pelagicoccus sp. SDUM812002]
MKYKFPTEHVVQGKPVTIEAFIALLIFALPIAAVAFTFYYIATRKKVSSGTTSRAKQR